MYSHPCMHNSYRVTIAPIARRHANGRRIYQVVACARGIYTEQRKIWRQPYDAKHWVLNLPYPCKVGTFINPTKALFKQTTPVAIAPQVMWAKTSPDASLSVLHQPTLVTANEETSENLAARVPG